MHPETLATFFERQGFRTFKSESGYWYNVYSGFYFYIPYHRLITPSKGEIDHILWTRPCIAVRYFTTLNDVGKTSYMIECSDKSYNITSVNAKYARRQTRRGLENFTIKQIDICDLADCNRINVDTLSRTGRNAEIWTEKKWRSFCAAAKGLDGLEAWGAFYNGVLAAYLAAYQMDDYFYIFHQSSLTDYLPLYPNNALVFYVTRLKLTSNEINHVSYGPESLDAEASLDTFKFRMGFQKVPMKQGISFHPLVKPLFNRFTSRLIHKIASVRTEEYFWRKLEGVLRFYQEVS